MPDDRPVFLKSVPNLIEIDGKLLKVFLRNANFSDAPTLPISLTSNSEVEGFTDLVGAIAIAKFLGSAIATGVLAKLGGNIWDSLTGAWDLKNAYGESVHAMAQLLSAAFDESDLQHTKDEVDYARLALSDYHTAPSNRLGTLDSAEAHSREALITLMKPKFRLAGYGAFWIGGGIHLAISQERIINLRDPKEVEVMLKKLGWLGEHYRLVDAEALAAEKARVSDVQFQIITLDGGIRETVQAYYSVSGVGTFFGQKIEYSRQKEGEGLNALRRTYDALIPVRNEHFNKLLAEYNENLVTRIQPIFQQWVEGCDKATDLLK